MYDVGTVQPVPVKVYDYYNPGKHYFLVKWQITGEFFMSLIHLVLFCISLQLILARKFIHRIQKVRYLKAFVTRVIASVRKVFSKRRIPCLV